MNSKALAFHSGIRYLNRRTQAMTRGCAVVFLSGLAGLSGHAQDAAPSVGAGDCTAIDLRYTRTSAPLTDAEISAQRDAVQQESLNQFERCASAATGGAGGGAGGGGGNGSVAGSGVAGAASAIQSADTESSEAPEQPPAEVAQTSEQPTEPATGQGRAPIDIPPADSDGVLAAQVRRAAEAETDPERRDRLWNEYRKIKGLATR